MGIRLTIVATALCGVYMFLLFHLYDLQIRTGDVYAKAASSQDASQAFLPPRRTIFFTDKNGNHVPAAINKESPSVFIVPKEVDDILEISNQLASILSLTPEAIQKKMATGGNGSLLLAKKISDDELNQIVESNIKGVSIQKSSSRFYPFGEAASQVLGYVGPRSDVVAVEQGFYGLEEFYQDELQPKETSVANVDDFVTTIDPVIQNEAEKILENVIKNYKAEGGTFIVEEPATGKILAMGNFPNFDPNMYSKAKLSDLVNPATQRVYEPGSVFKVLTMAAGIDAGKITPQTTFNDTGSLTLNGFTIRNWDKKAHGTITMTNVIEDSVNTGAAFAQRMTGNETFKNYITKFGFAEKTGIDLPAEAKNDLRQLFAKDAPPVEFATASFGQGVAVTPLSMINAFAAIANDGVLMRPYLNAALSPEIIRRVITKNTADQVKKMMISAVDKARVAHIDGYAVAGKTGTAFIPDFKKGGYTDDVINTYIGFAPVSNPRFVILIKLVKPEGAPIAGLTVVPAFKELAHFILNYYNIPPDRIP